MCLDRFHFVYGDDAWEEETPYARLFERDMSVRNMVMDLGRTDGYRRQRLSKPAFSYPLFSIFSYLVSLFAR